MTAKNMKKLEQDYGEITELYRLADDLIMTTEHAQITDKDGQIDLVEPLVSAVAESTDVLGEEFLVLAEGKPARKSAAKGRIENALRKVYMAIHDYGRRASEVSATVRKITDPLVTRIKRQLEVVVATLVEFVQISLEVIMQKQDVEELKQRQERIALMLHAMGQAT
jgi:hypothetical protein